MFNDLAKILSIGIINTSFSIPCNVNKRIFYNILFGIYSLWSIWKKYEYNYSINSTIDEMHYNHLSVLINHMQWTILPYIVFQINLLFEI